MILQAIVWKTRVLSVITACVTLAALNVYAPKKTKKTPSAFDIKRSARPATPFYTSAPTDAEEAALQLHGTRSPFPKIRPSTPYAAPHPAAAVSPASTTTLPSVASASPRSDASSHSSPSIRKAKKRVNFAEAPREKEFSDEEPPEITGGREAHFPRPKTPKRKNQVKTKHAAST